MTKKEILQFVKKRKWEKFLTRPYTPLFMSMHINVYYEALKELLGINFKNFIYINQGGNVSIYRDASSVKKVNNKVYNVLTRNPKRANQLLNEGKKTKIKIKNIIKQAKKLKKTTFSDFIQNFKLYSKIFARLTVIPFYFGMNIENKLDATMPRFKKNIKEIEKLRNIDYYQNFNHYVLGNYLRKLSKENNLSYSLTWQLTFPEILQLVYKNIRPNKQELHQRKKQFVYIFFNNKTRIISEKNFTDKINKIICSENNKQQKIISGKIAQVGKAIGRAKIIQSIKDIKKFKTGNILVSISTNPDLMPALRIAKAIVTDEGGLISHAAIIARELNIPCIIGTKIATKILHDGQLVEVDANKGIVKIIK